MNLHEAIHQIVVFDNSGGVKLDVVVKGLMELSSKGEIPQSIKDLRIDSVERVIREEILDLDIVEYNYRVGEVSLCRKFVCQCEPEDKGKQKPKPDPPVISKVLIGSPYQRRWHEPKNVVFDASTKKREYLAIFQWFLFCEERGQYSGFVKDLEQKREEISKLNKANEFLEKGVAKVDLSELDSLFRDLTVRRVIDKLKSLETMKRQLAEKERDFENYNIAKNENAKMEERTIAAKKFTAATMDIPYCNYSILEVADPSQVKP